MLPHAIIAPLFAVSAELVLVLILVVLAALIGGAVGLWRMLGKTPRLNRTYEHGRQLLAKGDWQGAVRAVEELRQLGADDPPWPGRINNLEGECERAAGDEALKERRFEEALDHFARAAKLLGLSRDEGSDRVVEAMLADLRADGRVERCRHHQTGPAHPATALALRRGIILAGIVVHSSEPPRTGDASSARGA